MYKPDFNPFILNDWNDFCAFLGMNFFKSLLTVSLALAVFALVGFNSTKENEKKGPKVKSIKFGQIKVDGILYEKDIVIEGYDVRKRKKGPSKPDRAKYDHTPLTHHEEIPWDCKVLVIGIGMSERLPVTDKFKAVAKKKGVTLILMSTPEAVEYYNKNFSKDMNAIFHITC
ncbi:MAG: hypothetical protein HRT57_12100 [Crocinitomicaceae bacterium]|nr:hypothetical protein [Crocinitomicaceae bacterium]